MNPLSNSASGLVRNIVKQYNQAELELCLNNQLSSQCNTCMANDDAEFTVNILARAGFVKKLQRQGYSLNQAMRELGKRMRALQ